MYKLKKLQRGGFKENSPKIYTDRKEFEQAQKLYTDSLNLYKAYVMQDNLMGGKGRGARNSNTSDWTIDNLKKARIKRIFPGLENYGPMSHDFQNEEDMFTNNFFPTENDRKLIKYYKSLGFNDDNIMYHTSADVIHPTIKPVGTYFDGSAYSPIYKRPTQPVTFQPFTHPIQKMNRLPSLPLINSTNRNLKANFLPIPAPPQQQGNPFYGPGNSIIGYVDGQRKFTPAQKYTGAPNNQSNLKDKYLLDNLDQLKQYVSKFDNYNFQKGGKVSNQKPLTHQQKMYDYIRPSDYTDLNNYKRWMHGIKRTEFDDPRSEEAFRLYLNLENNPKYFSKSQYEPTINKNPNTKFYYKVDPQLEQEIFNTYKDKVKLNQIYATDESEVISQLDESHPGYFVESGKPYIAHVPKDKKLIPGRPMVSNARTLGEFVVSRGKDKQGEYISYADQYDFPDWIQNRLKGNPYNIYGRIYYPKDTLKPVKK